LSLPTCPKPGHAERRACFFEKPTFFEKASSEGLVRLLEEPAAADTPAAAVLEDASLLVLLLIKIFEGRKGEGRALK
jgi:hypothetical protein